MLIIQNLPRTSAFVRATLGDAAEWSVDTHIAAATFDAIQVGNWQRQGKANTPRPRPFPRPGHDRKPALGGSVMTLDEAREKERRRQRALKESVV